MIPKKIYIDNNPKLRYYQRKRYEKSDHVYISVDAMKEWADNNCDMGGDIPRESLLEFLNSEE